MLRLEQPRHPRAPGRLEIRIGIVDSTRNPSVSNHRRFLRVQALVADVLIPLSERHPIVEVRVKWAEDTNRAGKVRAPGRP